ncbi:BMP family ABC transporter substrate-binding protein [Litchfieldia salsa]|uniref:Transcriptional activator of comK protein n=1 Tax=Litchfieldia salsa TaxID=930152 RepID=A0A1H0VXG8_9BACI|nr:BMP family ABC transporter substrate-binding protein [Litchfieldia salsa]SDP82885.1 transcriptional activator of comK gene [Litchfieldia salsa]
MVRQKKQLRIILLITIIIAVSFFTSLIVKTKGILVEDKEVNSKGKITILTSDRIVDQSWGSLAYKGKLQIEEKFPVTVELLSEIHSNQLIEESVEKAIENGSEIIIGHGREFTDVFTEYAPSYPTTRFVTIHGKASHPNQTVYSFDHAEIEYFAALAASLKTKTKHVAVIDGFDNRANNIEFETGLKHYDPEIKSTYQFVEDRKDGENAFEIAQDLINQGVDVIYSKGNSFNREVIDLAKEEGISIIGYLDDQSYMGPDQVLTSVINDVPQIYVAIMNDHFSETGIPPGKIMLGKNDHIYELAPFGPMYTEEEKQYIHSEIERYYRGELIFDSPKQ